MSQETKFNRLISEKSPYLLQHAENPVAWYPWSPEAFRKAGEEEKPVFLSIGYSTCHWCHVMAHESFENAEIADYLNEHFISIKVDREERPDVDHVYMTAVQAIIGSGGWPLSVFLTPAKKPFFGGTYFPPYAKWGSPGFLDVLKSIHQTWQTNRAQILESAQQLTGALRERAVSPKGKAQLDASVFERAFKQFESMYDTEQGGFGHAPKFPTAHNLSFLLRYWKRTQNPQALEMVERTLVGMAKGGIYDQIGGGFHRYAVDADWQIPHFEKMLYDQAIAARAYLEAYQITKKPFYGQIARDIFDYVLRDMTNRDGGFYSAEDADSYEDAEAAASHDKKEGAFYLWRDKELDHILTKEETEIVRILYGISETGNAKFDPQGEFAGKNILSAEKTPQKTAELTGKSEKEVQALLKSAKKKLFEARVLRPRPHLDDKILTDWNGLMIASLAFGAEVLQEPGYLRAAERAAEFIRQHLVEDGKLLHRYRDGEAGMGATLDDYAFFVHGLLEVYTAGGQASYLEWAVHLGRQMIDLFWDAEEGGFFFVASGGEKLLFPQKELYDGALPSGNSMAAWDLIRLYHLTADSAWEETLKKQLAYFSKDCLQRPAAHAQFLIAFDFTVGPSQEIVISEGDKGEAPEIFRRLINTFFLPNKVLLWKGKESGYKIGTLAPLTKDQKALNNRTTVYVCRDRVCQRPLTEKEDVARILETF